MVDDLVSFQRIAPEVETNKPQQWCGFIEIFAWNSPPINDFVDVVIEAFGCTLPDAYVEAMAARRPPPLWINLEYLSAEAWVAEHHLLASVHPTLGLTKTFFFPGFVQGTGGLIREADLPAPNLPAPALDPALGSPLKVFMFAYDVPVSVAIGETIMASSAVASLTIPLGELAKRLSGTGSAKLHAVPFVPQPEFDVVLRSHDVLLVRGEDSFVRAQWAAKPFVWQIYPQAEGAHWPKLEAFLAIYCCGLSSPAEQAVRGLWLEMNGGHGGDSSVPASAYWEAFVAHLAEIANHAVGWAKALRQQPDLASNLVAQVEKTAKTP